MDELSEDDKLTVARARKIQRFLSQPFQVAEVFTGHDGKLVPLKVMFTLCYVVPATVFVFCYSVYAPQLVVPKQLLQLSYMYMRIGRASHWNGVRIQGVSVISKPTL